MDGSAGRASRETCVAGAPCMACATMKRVFCGWRYESSMRTAMPMDMSSCTSVRMAMGIFTEHTST